MTPQTRSRLRAGLAWAGTAALLGYLFWRVPLGEVAHYVRELPPVSVVTSVAILIAIYVLDSMATWASFRRLGWEVPARGVFLARGSSYLLASINYVAGQGSMAVVLKSQPGFTPRKAAAAMLLIAFANFEVLLMLSAAGITAASEVPRLLPAFIAAGAFGTLVFAVLLHARPARLEALPVVGDLLSAPATAYAWATLVRVPHVVALILYSYNMLNAFGVDVPLAQAAIYLPIMYLIALLPISVQGLGTSQAAMVSFFSRFAAGDAAAREARVLASSLTAFAILVVFQTLLGLACISTGPSTRPARE